MQAYNTFSSSVQDLIRDAVADAVSYVNDTASDLEGSDRADTLSLETVEKQAIFALWQQLDPNSDSSEDRVITMLMRRAIRDAVYNRVQFICK